MCHFWTKIDAAYGTPTALGVRYREYEQAR